MANARVFHNNEIHNNEIHNNERTPKFMLMWPIFSDPNIV